MSRLLTGKIIYKNKKPYDVKLFSGGGVDSNLDSKNLKALRTGKFIPRCGACREEIKGDFFTYTIQAIGLYTGSSRFAPRPATRSGNSRNEP